MASSPLRTIEVSGTAFERGRQYGEQAGDLILTALEYYRDAFGQQTGLDWDGVRNRARPWLAHVEQHAPELLEEMRGVAHGAGRDELDLMVLNARGEIIYDGGFAQTTRPLPADAMTDADAADGCTSFAIAGEASGDGHVYAGQNWDWRAGTQSTLLAIRIVQDPLPTVVMQVEAGQIGRHGANSAGIALNANGLGGRFNDIRGMPQAFIRRMALNQSELPDALNVLARTRAHIASNAVLSHRSGFAIDLEITPEGMDWLYPTAGLLVHGNHYQAALPPQLAGRYRPVSIDSLFRVPRAVEGLARVSTADSPSRSRELIRAAMSDHFGYPESVCTHPDERRPEVRQWATVLSSCVDLTAGDYAVTNGTPCDNEYQFLPWNVLDGPGSRFPG